MENIETAWVDVGTTSVGTATTRPVGSNFTLAPGSKASHELPNTSGALGNVMTIDDERIKSHLNRMVHGSVGGERTTGC